MLKDLFAQVPGTTAEALEVFDSAGSVEPDFMFGTWRGAEVPTGHPMDGLLAATGWWGKRFVDAETVHPLLFPAPDGASLWAFDPAKAFLGLGLTRRLPGLRDRSLAGPVGSLRPVLRTRSPRARLRTTRYRGTDTATMIYDQVPVNDVFRRLSDDAVLGLMDMRGLRSPYVFVLRRDDSLRMER
ncbi:DUF4334 domain-containing protein [Streptomyces sp. NPDC046860]|uniref:DUF4334 domain-containing protein n=1 Tax=Streptomyces sp. NPDC046860 TaxID=3154495 RepID=UPI0033FE9712